MYIKGKDFCFIAHFYWKLEKVYILPSISLRFADTYTNICFNWINLWVILQFKKKKYYD